MRQKQKITVEVVMPEVEGTSATRPWIRATEILLAAKGRKEARRDSIAHASISPSPDSHHVAEILTFSHR